ncbi:MAG TPA: glycosyltransferase, partial [Nocardioides sp.]
GISDVVRFVPPVRQDQLALWYSAASVVAVPSYNESFGLVAVEAQACGTPVVAAAVGGLTTAVHHGRSGLLVDGHDPAQWADALTNAIASHSRWSALADGAREHAQDFSWDLTARNTLEVYEEAKMLMREELTA